MSLKQMLKYITENFNVIVFFPWYFIFKSSESASDQIRSDQSLNRVRLFATP